MRNWKTIFFWAIFGTTFILFDGSAQVNADSSAMYFFIKKELNTGMVFNLNAEREELRSDVSRDFEEFRKGSAAFMWENRSWVVLPFREEFRNISVKAGPYIGKGDWIDSSKVQFIDAGQKLAGISANIRAGYSGRFYVDNKNYTLVDVSAWGNYSVFQRNAEGTLADSNNVVVPYDEKSEHAKLRYGFQAKAGWGMGRLKPVNHYRAAHWLLEKHYPGRLFSDAEIVNVATEIGRIKNSRDARTGHSAEKEWEQLGDFLNRRMFLEIPEDGQTDWQYTEFRPRYKGSRVELGPFFNYFNREPDFVYGGYLKYEHHNYCSLKRSRILSASLSYNGYKRKDWILLETEMGWSFYPGLKTEYRVGLKYIPGMVVDGFDDLGPVRHNIIPCFEYFSQVSPKYRVESAFAWRFAPNDQFMVPGPEISVSVYRSRY